MLAAAGFVALGFGIGTLGTLIGAGGGFILLPVLALLFPQEPTGTLTATSLAVVAANATSGAIVVGIRDSRRRRRTIVAAVAVLSLVMSQLYREPFAFAIPLGHEAQTVIDRLLAPPSIAAEPGFSARLLVAPGELYDPLRHQQPAWFGVLLWPE